MSSLLSATKISAASAELNMNNEEHMDDIEKLLHLVDLLKTSCGDFIIEFHVAPMSLVQDKLSEIKKFKFFIVYNNSYVGEELESLKEDCTDYIKALFDGEFEDIEPITDVYYYSSWLWNEPTLCLYSLLGKPRWDDINDSTKSWIKELCCEMKVAISISYHSINAKPKCIFLHLKEATDRVLYKRNFDLFKSKFGLELTEKAGKGNSIYCVPVVGKKPIQYDIPYVYLDENSECLQENSTELEE